jgi:hypothetical protein
VKTTVVEASNYPIPEDTLQSPLTGPSVCSPRGFARKQSDRWDASGC